MAVRTRVPGIVLLLACVVPLTAAHANSDKMRVGGITYRFPQDSFAQDIVEPGPQSGFLLQLIWPGMRGFTAAEQFEWQPASLTLLALSGASKDGDALPAQALSADFRNDLLVSISPGGDAHFPLMLDKDSPVGAAPGIGMTKVRSVAWLDLPHDIFVNNPLDDPTEFIDCQRNGGPGTNPLCDQIFMSGNLILKVTYERGLVPQWLNIHRSIVRFFKKHEIEP